MPKAYCPNCDATISLEKPRLGAAVNCRECDAELEVISIAPLELGFPLTYYDRESDDDLEED